MSDTYLTLTQFEDFMQSLTMSMLGWDGNDPTRDVRIGWQQGGAPAPSITDNMVYLECYEVDSPINRQREITNTYVISPDEFNQATSYTIVMQANFVLYGDDCYENAQRIRDQIFYPDNKLTLAKSNLYLVHDIAAPKRVPEFFMDQWWKRCDLSMSFNELVIRNVTVPVIESMEVVVKDSDNNEIADINI
jgi:hypothetical protein